MAFPQTVLPLSVELYLSGAWTDVTSYVQRRDGLVQITRGRSTEGDQVDHSRLALALDNRDGRYSPRNPTGTYYGQLTRNTPIRVAVEGSGKYLALPGDTTSKATCPDAAALGITGDIDIRIDVELTNWRASMDLAAKWLASGNQRSWLLWISTTSGTLSLSWSTAGTEATVLTRSSTVPIPAPASGRLALRATLDVNDGSGNHVVTFYTAPTISGSWTQLGDPVTTSGTTSIFDGTGEIEVGDAADLAASPITGRCYGFKLLSGIAGSEVANPDFTAQTVGATSFADTASSPNTWTVEGAASITNRVYRFAGEVSSWPPRWDTSGSDVWTPIEAAGPMRRLSQGATVLGSALYRGYLRDASSLVAYWPMEDAEGSTSLAPALDHPGMTIIGTPTLASFESFVASNPLPVLAGAEFRGSVPAYTTGTQTQVRFLLAVPSGGAEDGQTLVMWYCTGSTRRWTVYYGVTGGTLGVKAFDGSGTQLLDTGGLAFAVNGELLLVSVELTQDGADVDYTISTLEPGASSGLTSSGTLASQTVGRVGTVVVSPDGGVASVTIGHLAVQSTITSLFALGEQLDAWRGEKAGRRIERLCSEEGVTFQARGDLDDTTRLGAQRPGALMALIREAVDADDGMLYEARDVVGLGYRTRSSLYNQSAKVTLDYDSGELAGSLEPTDDDQNVRNDVTVTRDGGSSARAVLETGALSVLSPPSGVGRYESSVSLNVEYDLDLFDQAGWRLHTGTVDETRYPQIAVNLAARASNTSLIANIHAAEVGDRIVITDPPNWLPPDDISQIVQGYTETLGNYEHDIVWNCSPESPFQVAVYGTSRYGPHSTVLNEALDTTETGVDITTPTGPLWSTSPGGNFDILVGGERMTVTAVGAAAGTVQTLTVTRSVNGVVKSHSSGAQVQLYTPSIYAL